MSCQARPTSVTEVDGAQVSRAQSPVQEDGPLFYVRDIPIYGDVIFAPMAGFADVPTRNICRQFGSAMNYTEFVAVEEVLNGTRRAKSLLEFNEADRPMVFQLFGNDANKILRAAQRAEELGPDIIDINMGCSTRRVSGRGAGVGMMLKLDLIAETFRLLTHHLQVPVTGKIRLGWEDNQNYLEVARILEDNGASLIALHPRTKEQQYRGRARWDAIAELRETVSVPVIGNGDLIAPHHIDEMLNETGCQAVMIGRGALGNPWLLARLDKRKLRFCKVSRVISDHLLQMLDYHGDRGLVLFRKHLKRYLAGIPILNGYYRNMVMAESVQDFQNVLTEATVMYGEQTVQALTG